MPPGTNICLLDLINHAGSSCAFSGTVVCLGTYVISWFSRLVQYDTVHMVTSRLGPAQDVNVYTRALIWVHYKVVHKLFKPTFRLFSHLNSAWHNLVIGFCCELKIIHFHYGYLVNLRTVLWLLNYWLVQKCKIPFLLLKRYLNILAEWIVFFKYRVIYQKNDFDYSSKLVVWHFSISRYFSKVGSNQKQFDQSSNRSHFSI